MKATEVLYNLNPYQHLLDELHRKESDTDTELSKCLKCQYNFITLALNRKLDDTLVVKVSFERRKGVIVLDDIYIEDSFRKEALERLIKGNKEVHEAHWHTEPNNTWYHDNEVTCYLNIADEIAKMGSNCNAGDNYYPGYYSEILIRDNFIRLSQINLHNSRSIDHKSDYHMRKLIMTIPFIKGAVKPAFLDYQIGDLQIEFLDSSSVNNRICGEAIRTQILKEKANFEEENK